MNIPVCNVKLIVIKLMLTITTVSLILTALNSQIMISYHF